MINGLPNLCKNENCRRLANHVGQHHYRPVEAWEFFSEKDKNKIAKAGFATPRGGAKGAYQNHVVRSGKVIIPFERLGDIELSLYKNDYVVRLLPQQYFDGPGHPKKEFLSANATVRVGLNSFVLYRTHDTLERLPPLDGWHVRALTRNGQPVTKRVRGVIDSGEYVLRIPPIGDRPRRVEGPPQGVFAPEYADDDTNYLSKCVLAWLIIQTIGSPYTLTQATHLRAILQSEDLNDIDKYQFTGALRGTFASCPLCLRYLKYPELHATVSFADMDGLVNAGEQVEGATRSTIVNLFHLMPMLYHELTHIPRNVAWGHAVCNTRLGQRPCYSLQQIIDMNLKVGIIRDEGSIETFGWISDDSLMIRSPNGAVWMQLNGAIEEGPPEVQEVFDSVAEATPEIEWFGPDDEASDDHD